MRFRGATALALCTALSCGPPPRPARPGLAQGTVKRYRPLEISSDARRADLAVVLGTDDANGSTVLPLPAAPAPIVVSALAVDRGGGPASGTAQAIVLTSTAGGGASTPSGAAGCANASGVASPGNGSHGSSSPSNAADPWRASSPPSANTSSGSNPPNDANTLGASNPPPGPNAPGPSAGSTAVSASTTAGAAVPVQVDGADDSLAGARWRAGAWSAALVASTALGKDLADVALSATPAGPVEGTASALVAAGFVAVMLGDSLDPAATLTGAIEPDGAIGPVAGLPEQVAAAIAQGKTRIGIPVGMRVARAAANGQEVDVARLAHERHADVVEVGDVDDAYQLLTGHQLPAPVPVAAAAMALDRAALDRLDARYGVWQRKLAEEWAPLLQLEQAGRMPAAVTVLLRVAHDRSEHAEALHHAGKRVGAYGEMLAGWLYAAAANQTYAVMGKLAAGDPAAAMAALTALDTGDAELRAVLGRIAARQPSTIAGHVAMLQALQAALRGWAYHEMAADSLRTTAQLLGELQGKPPADVGSPATAEAVSGAVAPTVLRMLRASAEASVAEQELALAPDDGAACTCAPGELSRAAVALQAAAAAALGHVDALVVEPIARKAGLAADAARRRVAAIEPDYLIADQLARGGLPRELAASWGDGSVAASLLALAAPRAAFHSAALVVAKYDALGVHSDDTGRIDAVNHPQAFRALVAAAERRARAAARTALVATGAVPLPARLAYQVAVASASGTLDDQLYALGELWTSTAFSEAAVILARSCR
jgi:hypothetical protein